MIGSLKGKISHIFDNHILLDVNSVGYLVFFPARNLANLQINNEIFTFIFTLVKEDELSLYGFTHILDKNIFLELIKVNGVGPKTALNILGIMEASEIIDAINLADQTSFTRVSGIGPKAAVRIINDLKDKINKLSNTANLNITETSLNNQSVETTLLKDSLSALENLGYQKNQIIAIVKEIIKDEKDFSQIITKSLKKLAK